MSVSPINQEQDLFVCNDENPIPQTPEEIIEYFNGILSDIATQHNAVSEEGEFTGDIGKMLDEVKGLFKGVNLEQISFQQGEVDKYGHKTDVINIGEDRKIELEYYDDGKLHKIKCYDYSPQEENIRWFISPLTEFRDHSTTTIEKYINAKDKSFISSLYKNYFKGENQPAYTSGREPVSKIATEIKSELGNYEIEVLKQHGAEKGEFLKLAEKIFDLSKLNSNEYIYFQKENYWDDNFKYHGYIRFELPIIEENGKVDTQNIIIGKSNTNPDEIHFVFREKRGGFTYLEFPPRRRFTPESYVDTNDYLSQGFGRVQYNNSTIAIQHGWENGEKILKVELFNKGEAEPFYVGIPNSYAIEELLHYLYSKYFK